jgi:four helix bundle protein
MRPNADCNPIASLRQQPFDLCERTFQFALRVINLCKVLSRQPGVARTIANQLLRSGTSVGANVEEGKAGQSRADFISKYSISRKEARESRYWLRLLVASAIVNPAEGDPLIDEAEQLVKILTAILKKAQNK